MSKDNEDTPPKSPRHKPKKSFETKREANRKKRRRLEASKKRIRIANEKARKAAAACEAADQPGSVTNEQVKGKGREATPHVLPPLAAQIEEYLSSKELHDQVPKVHALMGGAGALASAIASNVEIIAWLAERICQLLLAKVAAEPGLQLYATMLHIGDGDTTVERAEIWYSRLIESGKKLANAVSPDSVMIFTPMVLTDVAAEGGGKVVRSRLLVLSVGINIAGKLDGACQKLQYLFPMGVGIEAGITTHRLDNDPAGLEVVLRQALRKATSPMQRVAISGTAQKTKAGYSQAVWGLRTLETLALIDIDAMFTAKGNLSGSIADLRRTARRRLKAAVKGHSALVPLGGIRHVFIDLWAVLGYRFRTPMIF